MRTTDDIFDEWLVLRCQSGDSKAMGTLVQRWHPRLIRLASRLLNDPTEAEDVVQSAWVDVVRKIGSVRDPSALRPWLFRVVANKSADCIRRKTKQREQESKLAATNSIQNQEHVQEATDDASQEIRRLMIAMRSLGENHHAILRLHYLEKLSLRQISQRLSIPQGTVKSRLHHARQRLRETLKGTDHE